ncbi:helix-turn-helix transcriptional regulator [Streptococcus porcinus]|uniref:DNA-binding helix-turn-helix protein n=1 Tax=Streptococcus porcinus str. Jelinkova 176 TaxID=873448 RepID=A0ABN0CUZ0_STRPO|nr:helix-turn-helix transcriptional regulator [Streptococcus porcinus]EGJ27027.1 DNA-binding helix-turn-helix protein [Streptococcus porcinus str. Jelinkova 176]SQG42420.1 transcriptional regulator [Streptococcus porcinus]
MKNNLQELRKTNKLSQAELADAMSVTRQTIISLEKGRYNASLELAFKLARYFHLTIEDIFYFEESREDE